MRALAHAATALLVAAHLALGAYNPADLTDMAQLRAYDDATLASVFASGTAVIPSQESPYNATGTPTYNFCVGRTFFSAFTPNSSVARSVWPTGVDSPINNLAERVWWGKVFYNDGSNSPYTQGWNLLWSNKTVGLGVVAFVNETSPSGDGKPSVFIDYSQMEDGLVRSFLDEVRLINNNIWLGRVYTTDILRFQKFTGAGKGRKNWKYNGLNAGANKFIQDFFDWSGLLGPTSYTNVPTGGYYFLGYFAMQCIGPKTPKLRYTALTYLDAAIGVKDGLLEPDFQLAKLPSAPDAGAIAGPGFPAATESQAGFFPKFRVWPWRWSDVRLTANITQMKPWKLEPVLGEVPLYPIVAQAMKEWRAGNRSALGWTPTQAQYVAVKEIEAIKALQLAEAVHARAVVAGEAWPILPGLPLDDNQPPKIDPPLWDWAIDAIAAANAAAAEAKKDNSTWNPLAAAISEARYLGQLKITVIEDAASAAASTVLQPKTLPVFNATAAEGLQAALQALKIGRANFTKPTGFAPIKVTNKTLNWTALPLKSKPGPVNWTLFGEQIENAATPTKLTKPGVTLPVPINPQLLGPQG